MYVCLCSAVTQRQIEQAMAAGARSLGDLGRELGVAAGCGQCAATAAAILAGEDPIQAAHAPRPAGAGAGVVGHAGNGDLQPRPARG